MTDKDGKFQYSSIVKIKTPKKALMIGKIFPNPTSGKVNIEIVSDSRKSLTTEVYDLLGKKVARFIISVEQGLNQKAISVNNLATGTYVLQILDEAGIVVEKTKLIRN